MTNRVFLIGIVAGLAAAFGLVGLFSTLLNESTAQMMSGNQMGMMGNNMGTGFGQSASSQVPWHWSNKASFGANGISNIENVQITGISITGANQVTANLRYNGNGTTPSVVVIATADLMGMMGAMPMSNGMTGSMSGMHAGMMGMMPGGQQDMIIGPNMVYGGQMPTWNSTQWQKWHSRMAQWHGQIDSTQWTEMQAWHNQMMANPNMTMGHGMMLGEQMPFWGMWNNTAAMPIAWQEPLTGSSVLNSGWTSSTTVRITLAGDGSAYDTNNAVVMIYPLTS